MSKQHEEIITRHEDGSTILRISPGTTVSIYLAGTETLVDTVIADAHGKITVNLDTGKYDAKVDGVIYSTFEVVSHDYMTKHSETLTVHIAGAISADSDQSASVPIFAPGRVGVIERMVYTLHHIDATGDITVHVLKGASGGAAILTVATDSVYNKQINPGSEKYGYAIAPEIANIAVAASEIVTIGLDYTAGTVEGLTVTMIFKPDE